MIKYFVYLQKKNTKAMYTITHKKDGVARGVTPKVVLPNGIAIRIPVKHLHTFGFVACGPESGIEGALRTDNIDEQAIAVFDILAGELQLEMKQPKWHDIKAYMQKYKGKKLHGKIKPMPKVDSESIKRTVEIIDKEFQEICREMPE